MEEKVNITPDFVKFLEQHRLYIWELCNRYADGNPEVGLNHVQEISTLIWIGYHKLRPDATLTQQRRWINYIARDYFRGLSKRKKVPIQLYGDANRFATIPADTDDCSEYLEVYMECLSSAEKKILNLYFDGFKAKEIAVILGTNATVVRQQIHRITEHMKEYALKIEKK